MGRCRNLYTKMHKYWGLCLDSSWHWAEGVRNCFPPASMAPAPAPRGDRGYVPTAVCKWAFLWLLLRGSERVCTPCSAWEASCESKDLVTRNAVLSFSGVFPLVLDYSHQCWALPPSVGCCAVLDSIHIALFAFFLLFLSLLMVVCFLFMCGIKRTFEQELPNLNERGCCFWKIQQKPEQNRY